MDYEKIYVTGRGLVLVPRSEQAVAKKKEIGQIIEFEGKMFEIRGLESSWTLMSNPTEKERAYLVRELKSMEISDEWTN